MSANAVYRAPAASRTGRPEGGNPYGVFLATYVFGWCLFVLIMVLFNRPWPAWIDGGDFLILCLATFRLTSVVSEEKVARCLRAPFCKKVTVEDEDGTLREEEVPYEGGLRKTMGELILCPWCTGIWIATALTFFWLLAPGIARVCALAFAVAAGGLLFQILAKLMDRTRESISEA
jgi:hypothetical protein